MIYNIPNGNHSTRISFNRELFNYRIQSNNGKYDKKTEGVLKKYEKPIRNNFIKMKLRDKAYLTIKQLGISEIPTIKAPRVYNAKLDIIVKKSSFKLILKTPKK